MADKFNLDGFSVDTNNKCTAEGGFVSENTVVAPCFAGPEGGDTCLYGGNIDIATYSAQASINLASGGDIEITSATGSLVIANLPTSDPLVANALWNDSGTLKISSGS